jgi:hypothetical protein
MGDLGLWQPHINNCATTEVFVPIGQAGTSGPLGFCIEKDQRTAAEYQVARQTCLGLGKRLPEVVERTYACLNATGLNNITGSYEWSTNFPFIILSGSSNGLHASASGSVNCRDTAVGEVFAQNHTAETQAYRCVH